MRKFHLHEETASINNVNGMGKISLPNIGEIGSGDIISKKKKEEEEETKPKKLKKFNDVYENLINEKEYFFNISMINDTAGLISVIEQELRKKYKFENNTNIINDLSVINISYNAKVDVKSLQPLSHTLTISQNNLKKDIDKILSDNINFISESIEKSLEQFLNGNISLNESFLGRALGAIGGFALGPKVGEIICKVLGIQKGPLYNILTSRVVSAALAQELTKNLI
jgi:hypothetical protein